MRILFVTEEPIRFSGLMVRGGQIHVRNVISGLRERGHDVHLIDWNAEPDRSFQHSLTPRCRFVEGPFQSVQKVIRVGRSINPDVIVSKTRKVYLPGLVAAQIIDVPHVVHVGSSLDPPVSGLINRLDASSFVARLRAPHNAYFVVCNAIGDELQRRGINSNRIYDVRNAVDATRFVPDPNVDLPEEIRRRVSNTEEPVLGFVGGLFDNKGVHDLADAVKCSGTSPTVIVAGDGPAGNEFERELSDYGIFLGGVDYDLMPAVYAAFDALVLPSHTEGLPRVLLEAGAAGLPVVATAVGGVSEVVENGRTGLLCSPDDPSELAATIDRLFTERNVREMGRQARERIVDEYTWEAQYDRYESFLGKVTGSK